MFLCARRKAHIGSLVRQKKKQNALLTPLLVEGEAMAGAGRGTREEESGPPEGHLSPRSPLPLAGFGGLSGWNEEMIRYRWVID